MKDIFVNSEPAAVPESSNLGEYGSHSLAEVTHAIGATSVRIAAGELGAVDLTDPALEADLVEKMNRLR